MCRISAFPNSSKIIGKKVELTRYDAIYPVCFLLRPNPGQAIEAIVWKPTKKHKKPEWFVIRIFGWLFLINSSGSCCSVCAS